ncbi:MAG: GNAT family N-acetyltransferase [Candidatus Lokiarchaeota archaeon]|nr:GNAT family N-acetyltransferase [Candidatus Lokiarchaeota archaeon]
MKIEKFTMESYENIVDLWGKSGISVGSTDTRDEIERMLQRNPELFLIGKVDNKVIGVVMGGFDGRRGYVHHLAIDPDYQRRGFGTMIMDDILKKFRKIGVHKVHLFIEKYNKELVEFYKNLGWEMRDDLIMMSFVPDEKLYKRNL